MARRSNDRQSVTSLSLVYSAFLFQFLIAADSLSIYDPPPTLSYFWDPSPDPSQSVPARRRTSKSSVVSYQIGPHPSDPHSIILPSSSPKFNFASGENGPWRHRSRRTSSQYSDEHKFGPGNDTEQVHCIERVSGQELWVYGEERGFVILTLPASLI